jgi:formamidopyrimidine-DNA glycosylase
MPELPEVEIVAINLREWLQGSTVSKLEIIDEKILQNLTARTWKKHVQGRRCTAVTRRAKYLLCHFEGGRTLVGHLGMTGKIVKLAPDEGNRHSRFLVHLDNGQILSFKDPRRFGKAWLLDDAGLESLPELASLGPDPLVDGLALHYLSDRFGKTSRAIKVVLMEQSIIGGIGNILANEILFRCGIHPSRPASRLNDRDIRSIRKHTVAICKDTIRRETSAEVKYFGEVGAVNYFQVYLRDGEQCPQCGEAIERTNMGQRGTFFCPRCQRN